MRLSRPVPRNCRRPGCAGWPTASLSFGYADAQVRLIDLVDEPHPTRWDLCTFHADALQVPRGWERIDERGSAAPVDVDEASTGVLRPPAAGAPAVEEPRSAAGDVHDPVAEAESPSRPAASPAVGARVDAVPAPRRGRGNRYDALSARLPQLAAGQHGPRGREETTSPSERGAKREADDDGGPPRDREQGDHPFDNVPGQLVMPVGEAASVHDVGPPLVEDGFARETAPGTRDNVVPLVRRGVLDPVN